MLVATSAAAVAAAQWQLFNRQNNVGETMNYALGNKFRDAKLDHGGC